MDISNYMGQGYWFNMRSSYIIIVRDSRPRSLLILIDPKSETVVSQAKQDVGLKVSKRDH